MICNFIKRYCSKRDKIKVEKATVGIDEALCYTKSSEYPEPLKNAINEVGTKEFPGENHNPKIIEYHKSCELRAKTDEISWCSAFVNWCFLQSEDDSRTKSAAAISWAKWGEETNDPRIGDIVVFRRVGSSWRGHVGFYVGRKKGKILVLGGNQGNKVSFQWYPETGKSIYLFQFRSNRKS